MEQGLITAISNKIYQRFPEIKGARPSVKEQTTGHFLLIYKGATESVDGRTIQRVVRVVASADGKLIKVTTSR